MTDILKRLMHPPFGLDTSERLLIADAALEVARLRAALAGRGELMDALRTADAAIKEMFRYYDGGETRGSYDGKPERAQLRKAGYATSRAIAKAMGE